MGAIAVSGMLLVVHVQGTEYMKCCCSAADKDDSSEDISVPSSPHAEAIQHSSVSTSNGVSSTSKAEAVATSVLTQMADQSTEPVLSQIVLAPPSQAQPSGSWLETCVASVP